MKYRKINVADANKYNTIAGEMLNIEFNKQYYIDGKLQDDVPNKPYNVFNIKSVEYELHPNFGCLIVLGNQNVTKLSSKSLRRIYANMRCELESRLRGQHHPPRTDIGEIGTTQYLYIKKISHESSSTILDAKVRTSRYSYNTDSHFVWKLVMAAPDSRINYNHTMFYIPDYSRPYNNYHIHDNNIFLLSTSSLLIDVDDVLDLEDGYSSLDYPDITDYSIYKQNKIARNRIHCNYIFGINKHIAWYYSGYEFLLKNTYNYAPVVDKLTRYWIKWEDVHYKKKVNCEISWLDQLKSGNLYKQFHQNKSLDRKSAIKEDPRCFVTDIPIYEDCYVLDIYYRWVIDYIDPKMVDVGIKIGLIKKAKGGAIKKKKGLKKVWRKNYFKNPYQILISPVAYHGLCKNLYGSNITFDQWFTEKVGVGFIRYRTFCPRLTKDVINIMNCDVATKKILHAFNKNIAYTTQAYESVDNGTKCCLYDCVSTDLIVSHQPNNYIGFH